MGYVIKGFFMKHQSKFFSQPKNSKSDDANPKLNQLTHILTQQYPIDNVTDTFEKRLRNSSLKLSSIKLLKELTFMLEGLSIILSLVATSYFILEYQEPEKYKLVNDVFKQRGILTHDGLFMMIALVCYSSTSSTSGFLSVGLTTLLTAFLTSTLKNILDLEQARAEDYHNFLLNTDINSFLIDIGHSKEPGHLITHQ